MEITIGWWALPALVTVAAFTWATVRDKGPNGGDYAFGKAIDGLFGGVCALVATLVAWLIYFIVF